MSCYGWERGTLDLPGASVAPLKKALREAVNAEHDKIYTEAREWVRKHGARYRRQLAKDPHASPWHLDGANAPSEPAIWAIQAAKGKMPSHDQVTPKRVTSRTTVFMVSEEVAISFDGRAVTWDVAENNHAVDHAHELPIAVAFFTALNRVNWTRGSGGVFYGNDENNRAADYAGGGANYISASYGPKGKREAGYLSPAIEPRQRYAFRRTW